MNQVMGRTSLKPGDKRVAYAVPFRALNRIALYGTAPVTLISPAPSPSKIGTQ